MRSDAKGHSGLLAERDRSADEEHAVVLGRVRLEHAGEAVSHDAAVVEAERHAVVLERVPPLARTARRRRGRDVTRVLDEGTEVLEAPVLREADERAPREVRRVEVARVGPPGALEAQAVHGGHALELPVLLAHEGLVGEGEVPRRGAGRPHRRGAVAAARLPGAPPARLVRPLAAAGNRLRAQALGGQAVIYPSASR